MDLDNLPAELPTDDLNPGMEARLAGAENLPSDGAPEVAKEVSGLAVIKQIFAIEQALAMVASQVDALKEALGLGEIDPAGCQHPNIQDLSTMGDPHQYCPDCGIEIRGSQKGQPT